MNEDAVQPHKPKCSTCLFAGNTPLQRVLKVFAGVLIAGALITVIVVVVIWATGSLVSDPDTRAERNLAFARAQAARAEQHARETSRNPATYIPAVQARARLLLARREAAERTSVLTPAADELASTGTTDTLALYAEALVWSDDPARVTRAFVTMGRAAARADEDTPDLLRLVDAAYARMLVKRGEQEKAVPYYRRAALVEPLSLPLLLEYGKAAEAESLWYDAAFAYYTGLRYHPGDTRFTAALAAVRAVQPEKAEQARRAVSRKKVR